MCKTPSIELAVPAARQRAAQLVVAQADVREQRLITERWLQCCPLRVSTGGIVPENHGVLVASHPRQVVELHAAIEPGRAPASVRRAIVVCEREHRRRKAVEKPPEVVHRSVQHDVEVKDDHTIDVGQHPEEKRLPEERCCLHCAPIREVAMLRVNERGRIADHVKSAARRHRRRRRRRLRRDDGMELNRV